MNTELSNAAMVLNTSMDKQVHIYKEILQISSQQEKAIELQNEIALMELVQARETLMEDVVVLAQKSHKYRLYWDEHYQEADEAIRNELGAKVEELSKTIKEIMVIDNTTKKDLDEIRLKQAKTQTLKTNLKKIKNAYGGNNNNSIMDEKN